MMLRPAGDSSTDDDEDIEGFSIPKFNQKTKFTRVIEKRVETPFDIFKSAIFTNKIDLVQQAINQGVDVNETIGHGWTALMQACQIANAQLVQLLLTNGANPNISYEKMFPILILLKTKDDEENKLECLKLLLSSDSKYNCFDQYDMVPLMYAIKNNLVNIVDYLLSLPNINLNHIDKKGQTPLINAVKTKNASIVAKLIEAGALIEPLDMYNQSALDYAKLNNSREIMQLLGNEDEDDLSPGNIINSISVNFKELFLELPFYSRSVFKSDIINFLYGFNFCDPSVVCQQEIEFGQIISGNDSDLKKYGIALNFTRRQILENIKYLHMINWEREPLCFTNRKNIDLIDLMQYLYNLLRTHYIMTASINYLLNYINSDCFNKSHIDSKLIYNLKDEISRSIKICEIISLKMNEIKQITHNFKLHNKIEYGDLICPLKPKSKNKYLKCILVLGGISLTWIFFKRSLKIFS